MSLSIRTRGLSHIARGVKLKILNILKILKIN